MRCSTLRCLAISLVALTASSCGDGSATLQEPTPTGTHAEVLAQLGVDLNLPADSADVVRDPLADNPLGAQVGALKPCYEIFWMDGDHQGGPAAQILEDMGADEPLQLLHDFGGDADWAEHKYKNVIAADIDGDAFDEIVIAYVVRRADGSADDLWVKVVDKNDPAAGGGFTEYSELVRSGIEIREASRAAVERHLPSMATGDLDADGREEVVIGFWDLYVVKLLSTGYPLQVSRQDYFGAPRGLFVAAGDLDGNGFDEIVVTEEVRFGVLSWSFAGGFVPKSSWLQSRVVPANPYHESRGRQYIAGIRVAVGDIDDDRRNEVVFYGEMTLGSTVVTGVSAIRLAADEFEVLTFTAHGLPGYLSFGLVDFDGDGSLEVLAGGWMWRYAAAPQQRSGSGVEYAANSTSASYLQQTRSELLMDASGQPFVLGSDWDDYPHHSAIGDIDGDRMDDIVCVRPNGSGQVWIEAWTWAGIGDPVAHRISAPVTRGSQVPKIALANVDTDSTVVRYTGDHELLFSDPKVVAVLACPPYHAGIGQTNDLTGTAFGTSQTEVIDESWTSSTSVGYSIGVELEDDLFTQSKFAFELRQDVETGFSRRNVTEKSVSFTEVSGAGEDKVIFVVFPFDVYYYRVLSTGRHSDVKVGGMLTVSVPRQPQRRAVSRIFYNANNGDYADIDETVLGHTIGDVDSYLDYPYPSLSGRSGFYHGPFIVGQGSGLSIASLESGEGSGWDSFETITTSISEEVGTLGVVVGGYVSFEYGYEYSVTNINRTYFEGVINNLPPGYSQSVYGYSWGICAYPFSQDKDTFIVVNYWVKR